MGESRRNAKVLSSNAISVANILHDRAEVAGSMANTKTREALKQVGKPNSFSKTLRKTGVALILAPDPVTAVPGAVLLGASIVAKRKEASSAASVYEETRKLLADMKRLI